MSKNVCVTLTGVYFQKQTSSVCCVVKVGEEESASCRPVVTTQVSFSKNQVLRAVRRLTNLEANPMICLSAFALKKISNGHDDEQDVPDKKRLSLVFRKCQANRRQ